MTTLAPASTAPELPITCGLVVVTPAGWLLGHSTGTPYWDLPKGKLEPGEALLDAALRECWEETGLNLAAHRDRMEPLGVDVYNRKRGKRLALFVLSLPQPLDLSTCRSHTWVLRGDRAVLDMDAFAWVPATEVVQRVKPRMAKHLRRRGLLPSTVA